MAGRKGVLAPGADADVVVWDPDRTITVTQANRHGNVDYTPYEGMSSRARRRPSTCAARSPTATARCVAEAGSRALRAPRRSASRRPAAAVR